MTKATSEELPLLTMAADVLSKDDTQTDYVNVPEWGYRLKVRGLMGDERDRYETSFVTFVGNQRVMNMNNARARLVALGVIDEDGKRVFTTAQAVELGKKSAVALERVFSRIQELSGMTDEDIKKMVTVLGNGQTGGDGSA